MARVEDNFATIVAAVFEARAHRRFMHKINATSANAKNQE
jgi:hypothetical protein